MFTVTFLVVLVFTIAAAIVFVSGLIKLYKNDNKAQTILRNGYLIFIAGVLISCITFGFFSI